MLNFLLKDASMKTLINFFLFLFAVSLVACTAKKENSMQEQIRTELKKIDPPRDVQDTMNKVVKAENEKIAAIDYATAAETVADGVKRAKIKEAEGYKRAQVLHAEGEAEAIMLVNEAADKYFTGNAQLLKKLETVEASFKSCKNCCSHGFRTGKYYW